MEPNPNPPGKVHARYETAAMAMQELLEQARVTWTSSQSIAASFPRAHVTAPEFRDFIGKRFNIHLHDGEYEKLWALIDHHNSEALVRDELLYFFRPDIVPGDTTGSSFRVARDNDATNKDRGIDHRARMAANQARTDAATSSLTIDQIANLFVD